MKEVFVLGAGFSRAFVSRAPLVRGFLARCEDSLSSELKGFVRQSGLGRLDDLDIEKLLTLASLEAPWLEDEERLRLGLIREKILKLIQSVLERAFLMEEVAPTEMPQRGYDHDDHQTFRFAVDHARELDRLRDYLVDHAGDVDVISYNWDILLENQLEFAQWRVPVRERKGLNVPDWGSPYFHIGRSYGFQPIEVRPDGRTHSAERGAQRTDIHVFKLHGSVNWRCRRAPGVPVNSNDVLVLRCHDDILKADAARYAVDSEFESAPFIVPPVLDKAVFLRQPVLNVIWNRAAERVRNANRLVFIGYSFPMTDFYSEFLFRYHTPEECEVVAVDLREEHRQGELKDRYQSIFGNRVKFHFDGAVEFIRSHLHSDN